MVCRLLGGLIQKMLWYYIDNGWYWIDEGTLLSSDMTMDRNIFAKKKNVKRSLFWHIFGVFECGNIEDVQRWNCILVGMITR